MRAHRFHLLLLLTEEMDVNGLTEQLPKWQMINGIKWQVTSLGQIHANCSAKFQGMGRTWEKFSSLPAKKPRKFETATGKENF